MRRRPCPRHLRRWAFLPAAAARKGAQVGRPELEMTMTRLVEMERERSSKNGSGARSSVTAMAGCGRSPALRRGRRPRERLGASRGASGPRRPHLEGRGRLDTRQEG